MTYGWKGILPPNFEKGTLFELPKFAFVSTFKMNFDGKLPILNYFLQILAAQSHS